MDSSGTKCKLNKENSVRLWHKRLGHIFKSRIERLVTEGILDSFNFSDLNSALSVSRENRPNIRDLVSIDFRRLKIDTYKYLWIIPTAS